MSNGAGAALAAKITARLGRETNNFLGICVAVLATMLLIAVSGTGKHIACQLDPFVVTFIRSSLAVLLMAPVYFRLGFRRLRTARPGLHIFRSFIMAMAVLWWFWALPRVPLDLVTAVGFTSQLFAILGAVLFLGEASRGYRWGGLAVGFVGALIIIRPGAAGMDVAVLVLVGTALMFSAARLYGKVLAAVDRPDVIVLWQMVGITVFTFPVALFVWQWPTLEQWGWLVLLAFLTLLNNYAGAWAIRLADIGAVEPVSFLRLVWAALVGFAIFSEVPNLFTITGGVIVMAATIYIARRERQEGKANAVAELEPD